MHMDEFFTFDNIVLGPSSKAMTYEMIKDEMNETCGFRPKNELNKESNKDDRELFE